MKSLFLLLFTCISFVALAQEPTSNYRKKRLVVKDSIRIDTVSINPSKFSIKTKEGKLIDSTLYTIDFSKAILALKAPIETDTIEVEYLRYPNFITKVYKQLDDKIIVENNSGLEQLYKLQKSNKKNAFTPFDGLTTSGSISRGVTIGSNQNSVLNSELDLQISGKLSDKITLRASIQDANIPLQDNGYSQRLDEFDQVFIELLSNNWNIRAGDIDLTNTKTYFGNFTKRVQGLLVNANLSEKTSVFASGAVDRGQFTTSQFTAQEGNQGPYKLTGPNNELFVLIVSGSETVYVNGLPLKRGENNDYIIDYNAGEIIFNSTFPVTSEMRITVDYQFSDRNYSRLTVFGGGEYKTDKLTLNVSVFSESDAKNQPIQQNLSTEQTEILANAGDDRTLMVAPSATPESFSDNRILYRKETVGSEEIFVFSKNPDDELFSVNFTLVGANQGNYRLANINIISNVFEFVPPVSGIPQGDYEPIIQLVSPERLQIAVLNGRYKPTEKTDVYFELAGSKNDLNLFSNLDDGDNDGFAGKLKINQSLIKKDSLWNLSALIDTDFVQEDFRSPQRLYRAEFNRDWNLDQNPNSNTNPTAGNQLLFNSGLQLSHHKKGIITYDFEHLNYSENYNGNRHNLNADVRLGDFNIFTSTSYLNNSSPINRSTFLRSFNRLVYAKSNKWIGGKFAIEDNEQTEATSNILTPLSQRFMSYEGFAGIGDSTKVFAEIGYTKRFNDSLRNNSVERVSNSNTYYLKSRLLQNKKTNLQLFVNYRVLKFEEDAIDDEQSLNSRLNFNQKLLNNIILWNTSFETNSGTLAQQDFTFVEVDAGQGNYVWNDYNLNGVQELNEFEIAQFQDEGIFIRVLLPNQVFKPTHQNKLSQTLTINPKQWNASKSKFKKFWSHFYNQTSYLIERRVLREGNTLNLNPFNDDENEFNLNNSIRNVLFYNRGKQHYTTSYTFLSNRNRNLLSIGLQENKIRNHQFNFNHKIGNNWLISGLANFENETSLSIEDEENPIQNFVDRSYEIKGSQFQPKLSYLFNENAQFDVFFQYTSKENVVGDLETLEQQNYGLSFTYNKAQKISLNGGFNYFQNTFSGNANTPVAYQLLEGLQPGTNFTWNLIAQKKLTKFLDLNLNYFGRKTESSSTIHTGTIQLKAYF